MGKKEFTIELDTNQSSSARSLRQLVKQTIDGIFDLGEAQDGVDEDGRPYSDAYIEEAIRRAIEPIIRDVLLETLGIDRRWSRVVIKDDSPLGRVVCDRAMSHAKNVVDEFIATKGWPKLSASAMKAVEQHAKDALHEELQKRIVDLAVERAAQIPNETLLPIVDEVLFARYPILKKLEALNRLGTTTDAETQE